MEASSPARRVTETEADQGQYLTFMVMGEEYGIDILRVQEIRGFSKITPIPQAPRYVRGVLNLRGTVVPIVDLRLRLGMTEADYDQFTVIVVVNICSKTVGLVVDAVSDVVTISEEEVVDVPTFERDAGNSLTRMGKVGDKLVLLLNIDMLTLDHQLSEREVAAA